jgi:NAD(P)-dependent dehydrogenase (short-subunit alcohol dehydrogenase family)
MNVRNSVVFVTGANRGLGLAFAKAAHALGASKVYAGMRNPEGFDVPGLTPVKLDVTDEASVKAAAALCKDTSLLVNNAGIVSLMNGPLDPNMVELSQTLMNTNYYGIIRVTQAFAPILSANGGGAVINVLSDATWLSVPMLAAYAASKSAAWSLTNALRLQLKPQGTHVLALHVGFLDTDMTKGFDMPKTSPDVVARKVYAGLEHGALEVLGDEGTVQVKATLSTAEPVYFNPPSF